MTDRRSPQECADLMISESYVYLDVRTEHEFNQGHPDGAYNIPFMFMANHGMMPNPEFMAVVKAAFAPDTPLVLG